MKDYLEKLNELVALAKELEEISFEKKADELPTCQLLFTAISLREMLQSIAGLAKKIDEWRPF